MEKMGLKPYGQVNMIQKNGLRSVFTLTSLKCVLYGWKIVKGSLDTGSRMQRTATVSYHSSNGELF